MGLKENLFKQFSKPSGTLGSLVGWLMALKNRPRLRWGIEQLQAEPQHDILEIGFGPGSFIQLMLQEQGHGGNIAGVEISDVMLGQASRRNRAAIEARQVSLQQAPVEALPYADASFDRVFTSNTNMFWTDPGRALQEIRRVLKPEGVFCLTLQPYWAEDGEGVRREAEGIRQQMQDAGLTPAAPVFKEMRPIECLAIRAQR